MRFKEVIEIQKRNNDLLQVEYRLEILKKLKMVLVKNENVLYESIYQDLNKSEFETYMVEFSQVINELNYFIKNLKRLVKHKVVKTPFLLFKSKSYIKYFPKGVTLIISPWNYPIFLTFLPLIGNIAAGNKSILKLSNHSKFVSKTLYNLLSSNFEEKDIFVCDSNYEDYEELYSVKYDHIFFTGSDKIGKEIYQIAAKNLTPITLELGGKCPAIFFEDCLIDLSAKRFVFGKMLNSGQTCVAPNYMIVPKMIKDKVLESILKYYKIFYPKGIKTEYYPKIINCFNFNRQLKLLENQEIINEKEIDVENYKMGLTLVDIKDYLTNSLIKEEIFGPILGVIAYENEAELEKILCIIDNPLALYVFTKSKKNLSKLENIHCGSFIVNDTVSNLGNINLPFKGVNSSGLGMYRGKYSFYELSHLKVIYKRSNKIDLNLRYPKFTKKRLKNLKRFL